ncbi:hypothetical protein F6V25_09340 [Oryzomonas japonica]|uniref:Glycosyltransferase n=1 Tax=Oryzomonas japonica TaxID=2603858 RepID=A0A7J4ZQI7_9BACT|nr:glycosyltransferase [Oryzomonas japonica]KAB0665283.1 hypothetical protein F6V25_09340 [Oryzomonas japonica]
MYNYILISQFGIDTHFKKLQDSVINAKLNNIKVLLIFVNQTSDLYKNTSFDNADVVYINVNKQCSLSCARNIAIQYITDNRISADYVMIPDDDCWFNPAFFEGISSLPKNNYAFRVVDPYKKSNHLNFPVHPKKLSKYDYGVIMSINQIFVFDQFMQEGLFDTKLGVGALYPGSEDSDFFCRMCKYDNFYFVPEFEIYHLMHLSKFAEIDFIKLLKLINGYADGLYYFAYKNRLFHIILRATFATPLKVPYYYFKHNHKMAKIYLYNTFHNFSLFVRCLKRSW